MDELRVSFGIVAGVLGVAAGIPYIYTILRGETRPERAAAIIWFITAIVVFFSSWAEGARESLWFALGTLIVAFTTLALSIRYGYRWAGRRDAPAIFIALLGVGLWITTGKPFLALLLNVFVDALGSILVIVKSHEAPITENIFSWAIYAVASLFALMSVGRLDLALLLYPSYALIASIAIVGVVFIRRKHLQGKERA